MKSNPFSFAAVTVIALAFVSTTTTTAHAQRGTMQEPPRPTPPPEPPPYYRQMPAPPAADRSQAQPAYVYDQQPVAGRPALVTAEQAQSIIDRFKVEYPKLGNPRFLIYVNRELMERDDALKLLRRTERIERSSGSATNAGPSERVVTDSSYRATDRQPASLADRQTVRDVERLFGRPLRAGGATLVDQRIALSGSIASASAVKERETLQRVADVAVEILISSKEVTSAGFSGPRTVTIPDVQATAIRLSDARILAQASSADIAMRVPSGAMGTFGVQEICEATALELMEDLADTARGPAE